MQRLALTAALMVLMAAGARAQSAGSTADKEFEAIYSKFSEGYKLARPQMVADLYTRDAYYLSPGNKIERGYEFVLSQFSFLDAYKSRPTGPTIAFQIVERQVSGDIGWDIGYYFMNPDGKPITAEDKADGKFIVLWKRDASGQWKIFADGYSNVRN